MFSSSFSLVTSIVAVDVVLVWFNWSKHTIQEGITTLTSYSYANRIAFLCPTKFSTMCKTLKHESNMIAIMLWAYPASKDFKNSKKGLITFITSTCILLCKRRFLTSNKLDILGPLQSYNGAICISIVRVMVIVKTFDNNQWPLLWFITLDDITRFNIKMITLAIAQTWALSTLCFKATNFYLP
jgi:hypothetical protein